MLPKLCHLDNDLEIIIMIQYIYSTHDFHIPTLVQATRYLGTLFFSRYIPQCGPGPYTGLELFFFVDGLTAQSTWDRSPTRPKTW